MQMSGYFDNAATTVMSEAAMDTYLRVAREYWANPSSSHHGGKRAAAFLTEQRERAASLLGVDAKHIIFTGGATQSNDIILSSLLWRIRPQHYIASGAEHSSVLQWQALLSHAGWRATLLDAPGGFVDPQSVETALEMQTRLVSVMLVNNTLGTIQDVGAMVSLVRHFEAQHKSQPIHVHCDATQALGKISFDLKGLGVDSASFSAHKLHGPRGIGILYNTNQTIQSLSRGGGQEGGLRAGTEDLASIAAMVIAMQEAQSTLEKNLAHVTALNGRMRELLDGPTILTPSANSSPYILTIALPPLPSEVAERMLDDLGFAVSAGSACSHNARQKGAKVHNALRLDPSLSQSSIRISFSGDTSLKACEELASAINTLYRNHQ
jgi:cysteine desulfurase